MANNQTLSDAIQKMIDDCERTGAVAAVLIKEQINKDLNEIARSAVDKYYEYQNGSYTRSGRQHGLYGSYKVITDVKRNGNNYVINGGIYLFADFLDGLYESNSRYHQGAGSWESGGQVEPEYVLGNFLEGKHPWTNGWPTSGSERLETGYTLKKPSPNKIMSDYINNYQSKLDSHFSKAAEVLLKAYL